MTDLSDRRAIVLIPGYTRAERHQRRDQILANLQAAAQRYPIRDEDEVELEGLSGGRTMTVRWFSDDGETAKTIDLFEAYWGDMTIGLKAASALDRLKHGALLLAYWMLSPRMWLALSVSRYLTLGLLFSGVLLLLWYLTVIVIAAQALAGSEAATATLGGAAGGSLFGIPVIGAPLLELVTWISSNVPQWSAYAAVIAFLGATQADGIADVAYFTKAMLTNQVNETEVGLRDRLAKRVGGVLNNVYDAGYGEVIVVAHSFGTLIAIDLLAEHPNKAALANTRLITWGSPAAALAFRSAWLRKEVEALAARKALAGWDDYYSGADWVCAKAPAHHSGLGLSVKVKMDAGVIETLLGDSHEHYYSNQRVLEPLLAPDPGAAMGEEVERDAAPA